MGDLDALNIETQNCSIQEVLNSLADKLNFHYHSGADLTAPITGIYSGSLLHILPRLLRGYSFVVKSDIGQLDLTVLGVENAEARSKPESIRNNGGYIDNSVQSTSSTRDLTGLRSEKPQGGIKSEVIGNPGKHPDKIEEPEFGG